MRGMIRKVTAQLNFVLKRLYRKTGLLFNYIRYKSGRAAAYLRAHPKTKYALIGVTIPAVFVIILMSLVLYDIPDKRELKAIQNPIASEVYTADSVLIGRYFIQDRTQIKYEDISPVVID